MKLVILVLSLLCFNIGISKDSIENENRVSQLENQIISLKQQNLESEKLASNQDILDEYRHLISLFGVGFGILIGLFGIVFPLILYLVQVKPSLESIKETKELLKKLDDDFEKSFENHLQKNRHRLIDQAIENFKSQNIPMLSSSRSIIENYKNEGFSEIQVLKILKLLKSTIDSDTKDFLARILIFQEDENTEEYFQDLIKNDPKDKKGIWGALYFATYNKVEHLDLIAKVVINGYALVGMISSLCSISTNFAHRLLNNELLVNELDANEIKTYYDYGLKYFIEKTNSSMGEQTLIWKKFNP